MIRRALPLLLLAGAAALSAQGAPPAVQAVPPSDDSIYALRLDSAASHGYDVIPLYEEGVVRIEADGRSSYTIRQVAQILTPSGAEDWGEFAFGYTPGRQQVKINRMRVVSLLGKVLREGPEHQQESSPPVEAGSPVYSDRRTVNATLGGVTPGTIVDYSYTLETVRPWLPGDLRSLWRFNGQTPVRRSRFVLDAPADLDLRVKERNIAQAPAVALSGGRRIRTWTFADLPAVESQLAAGAPNTVIISVAVGGALSWADIGEWYRPLLADRYQLTPEVLAALTAQLRGARSLDDSLRAAYRWVAQDFRYVSLELGDGGYRPRLPEEVYRTRFGDCKDKTTLFVSLARRLGLRAYPVLVNSTGGIDTLMPTLKQFDHMIAAVEQGGRTQFADPTEPLAPYGQLSAVLEGEAGLALTAEGARVVVLPATPAATNRHDLEVVGSLETDGRFVGRATRSATGTEQYKLREQLADLRERDVKGRDEALRGYVSSIYATAAVDSAQYSDGRDLSVPPKVTVWFAAPNVVGRVGAGYYFNLTLSSFADPNMLKQLDAEGERRFPIDVASVNSPSIYRRALELQLPEGWKAELPAPVSVQGPFGYYRADFRQEGRTLRISREMGGLRGLQPSDSVKALRAWFEAVGADRTEMIVLQRNGGPALTQPADAEKPAGHLPDVLLAAGDLPRGAKLAREGTVLESTAFMLGVSQVEPLERYARSFGADQMVFSVGSSRLMALEVAGAAHHNRAEATRMMDLLGLVDVREELSKVMGQTLPPQTSLGAVRSMELPGVGDRASGWVLELNTPMATFEMAMVMAARGRASLAMMGVGVQGLKDADFAALLDTMDRRVKAREAYLTDLPGEPVVPHTEAADSALRASTSVALERIAVPLADTAGVGAADATFDREDGWPRYRLTTQGRGITFPFRGSEAIGVATEVTLHHTEAQALKRVLAAERRDRRRLLVQLVSGYPEMINDLAKDDSTSIAAVPAPAVGARSVALVVRTRRGLKSDVDAVYFARGRLSGLVIVSRRPGGSEPAAALAVAREMAERMGRVVPGEGGAAPSDALVAGVRQVVEAEAQVDSLVEAEAYDAVFRTIDRARLKQAPVGFAADTWNTVCWMASLNGHARQAGAACEAAVAPDTTVLAYRDSRGLQRALVGDTAGAIADFAYVVANSAAGSFLDTRAKWLEALRAGTNPFTEEVLKELR